MSEERDSRLFEELHGIREELRTLREDFEKRGMQEQFDEKISEIEVEQRLSEIEKELKEPPPQVKKRWFRR